MKQILLAWSSGKDSAWTLHVLRARRDAVVAGLFTTVNRVHERVAMHAVRLTLLRRQAEAVGLPLHTIDIPHPCSNAEYERAMGAFVSRARSAGVSHFAFGDLFLEDIRRYRIDQLKGTGVTPLFPLWQEPTPPLARRMVASGLRAVTTCIDPRRLAPRFAGRGFDARFLDDLPAQVDPCGENGEFHTFAYDGPMFARPVPVRVGGRVRRDGFVFADLLPQGAASVEGPGPC